MRRILSIDGGGIKGVFPAAFLACVEDTLSVRISDHFDLIVGTSTGGIIALALGLGISAADILSFYESDGAGIFERKRFGFIPLMRPKYDARNLQMALTRRFGDMKLGDSSTRLVLPSCSLETGEVYIFKTAHHARFRTDYRRTAVAVALATAAAPIYFRDFEQSALVDGGLWANDPTGVAAVEAAGVLQWSKEDVQLLSLGCTTTPQRRTNTSPWRGALFYGPRLLDLFMDSQSSGAQGTASILFGPERLHRISPILDRGRFKMDETDGIPGLKTLGQQEARKAMPFLAERFLCMTKEPFIPIYNERDEP
jgi:patatin-like phospholipase/acyl hydrolase